MDSSQMRFSRTQFDAGYRSDMEDYPRYYWVSVESGQLTLTFERGALIAHYTRDNRNDTRSFAPDKPGEETVTVTLDPGDIIALIDIRVSAYSEGPTTILTCGWVDQDHPAPCSGGCWLP
jgi:hypothetical protein